MKTNAIDTVAKNCMMRVRYDLGYLFMLCQKHIKSIAGNGQVGNHGTKINLYKPHKP